MKSRILPSAPAAFAAAFLLYPPVPVHAQKGKPLPSKPVQLPTARGPITVVSGPLGARQQASLAALGAVYVKVSTLAPDIEAAGLHQSDLQADAIAALKKAGVPLSSDPRSPRLLITPLVRVQPGYISVFMLAELVQPVLIGRNNRPGALGIALPTWQDMDFGVVAKGGIPLSGAQAKTVMPSVRARVQKSVALFIAAYKAANTVTKMAK